MSRKTTARNAGNVVRKFYAAFERKDVAAARRLLDDKLYFKGPFDTFHNADDYLQALGKLSQIVTRLDVKKIFSERNDASVFFELETKAPASATTLVAERHRVENGKISRVEAVFDPRPFEAMFGGAKR